MFKCIRIKKCYRYLYNAIHRFSLPTLGRKIRFLVNWGQIKTYCIVKIEGGITSQLEQYVLGRRLEELGLPVKYDLTFYKRGKGKDCLGINERNFDLLKLDEDATLAVASRFLVAVYKVFFSYPMDAENCLMLSSNNIPPLPLYLGGYGYGLYREAEFEECFKNSIKIKYSNELFGEENRKTLAFINSQHDSIGMHVRRGDILLPIVGRPVPKRQYYLYALSLFRKEIPVFIFSDDSQWVKEELLPYITNRSAYLIENNDSSAGWKDLILMAACKNQIKSPAGGMGRDAYRLNTNDNKQLIRPVFVKGNHLRTKGKIVDVVLNDELCDMTNVKDRQGVL